MAHKTFAEYLDNKNKMRDSGVVQQVADYSGPSASKPAKEKKHKDAGGKGQGDLKPYAGGTNAKDPNKGKITGGFADKGDSSLKYTPGKGKLGKSDKKAGIPGGKEVKSWPKTQEWIDRTKDLSLAEFTKQIQKTTSKGLDECACQNVAPLEVVKQTVTLAKANGSVMSSLVREMKRQKTYNKFVAEMLQHEQTYKVIAKFLEHDESYARRLVRAMNEMVGPPAHGKGFGDEAEDDEDPSKPPHPEDMHGDDDDDTGMDGPESLDNDDHDDMGDDDMEGDHDDPTEMGGHPDGPDPADGPHGPHGDPASDLAPGSKIMGQKKKKKHAHHHLMNALKDSPMGQDMGGMGGMGSGGGAI